MTYASQIALAKRLIAQYGQPAVFRRISNPDVTNVDAPWRPAQPGQTDYPCSAVFLNYSEKDTPDEFRQGDQRVLIPCTDVPVDPTPMDKVVRNGDEWAIISSKVLNPNGERIYIELQLRR